MKPPSRIVLAAAAMPIALLLAGCGGAGENTSAADEKSASGSSVGSSQRDVVPNGQPQGLKPGAVPGDASGDAAGSATAAKPAVTTALQRAVIATGSVRLTAKDLDRARGDAIALATGLGGHVDSEQSQSDRHGRLSNVNLTLRVPSSSFQKLVEALGELGTVRHREQSAQDVSTQVIDNDVRIKAQAASVRRVQQLLARANTIGEVVSVESELTRREADLDSLEQQQRWLADQTAMSTVQVSIALPPKAAKPRHHAPQRTGFLAGLEGGWHALAGTAVVLGTVAGALLPFAVVLALIGVPVWLTVRRRRAPLAPPPAAEA